MLRPLPLLVCILLLVPGTPAGAEDPASWSPRFPEDPREALLLAASANGLDPERIRELAETPPASAGFHESYLALLQTLGVPSVPIIGLPGDIAEAITPVVDAMTHAVRLRGDAVADLTPADWDQIHRLDNAHRASRELDDRTLLAAAWSDGGLPDGLDRTRITAAAYVLLDAGLTAAPALRAVAPAWALPHVAMGAGTCVDDGVGVLIVCGPNDDVLTGNHILEIDLGGNDHHATNAGGSGLGVLWTGSNGLPAALALDIAGDDSYSGSEQIQGVGSTTPGVLIDLEGSDTYSASAFFFTFAQGAGNLGGTGILYDALGNDAYHTPAGRHDGQTAWDSQGFGILGGTGLLHDASGSDQYIGGAMSQGVGDFNAVGMLLEGDGGDTYEAVSKAQGFGDGAGLGLLLEASGDESYLLWEDHGQGAGLGGNGILIDTTGDDGYVAFEGRSQGYGAPGPVWKPVNDILSLVGPLEGSGIVLDTQGTDHWSGRGCNLCVWNQGTGVGLDTI